MQFERMRLFMAKEIVVFGISRRWGSGACDLFSNPILTEKTPRH